VFCLLTRFKVGIKCFVYLPGLRLAFSVLFTYQVLGWHLVFCLLSRFKVGIKCFVYLPGLRLANPSELDDRMETLCFLSSIYPIVGIG